MRIAGVILGPDAPTPEEVRISMRVPSLQVKLRHLRLAYIARVARSGPAPLLFLLDQPEAKIWRDLCFDDMRAMRNRLAPKLQDLPDPAADLNPWVEIWRLFPSAWKTLCRAFIERVCTSEQPPLRQPVEFGPSLACDDEQSHVFACDACGKAFVTRASLRQHMAAKHGYRTEARNYVADGSCPACHAWFWTRLRALQHVRQSPRCKRFLLDHGTPIGLEFVRQLDEADRQARRDARRDGLDPCEASRPWLPRP